MKLTCGFMHFRESWASLVRKSRRLALLELFNQLSGLKIKEDDVKAIMKN